MPIATMNAAIAIRISSGLSVEIMHTLPRRRAMRRLRLATRPGIGVQHILQATLPARADDRARTRSITAGISRKDSRRSQKCADSDFIRGVQHGGSGTARFGRGASQPQARKPLEIRRFEVQPRRAQDVERFYTGGEPLRPAERMGDRRAHVRVAQLRQHRAVHVFHQRMHDALRMHDHFDLRRRQAEQQAGFDQLQPFVHAASPSPRRSCAPSPSADARRPVRA